MGLKDFYGNIRVLFLKFSCEDSVNYIFSQFLSHILKSHEYFMSTLNSLLLYHSNFFILFTLVLKK